MYGWGFWFPSRLSKVSLGLIASLSTIYLLCSENAANVPVISKSRNDENTGRAVVVVLIKDL